MLIPCLLLAIENAAVCHFEQLLPVTGYNCLYTTDLQFGISLPCSIKGAIYYPNKVLDLNVCKLCGSVN